MPKKIIASKQSDMSRCRRYQLRRRVRSNEFRPGGLFTTPNFQSSSSDESSDEVMSLTSPQNSTDGDRCATGNNQHSQSDSSKSEGGSSNTSSENDEGSQESDNEVLNLSGNSVSCNRSGQQSNATSNGENGTNSAENSTNGNTDEAMSDSRSSEDTLDSDQSSIATSSDEVMEDLDSGDERNQNVHAETDSGTSDHDSFSGDEHLDEAELFDEGEPHVERPNGEHNNGEDVENEEHMENHEENEEDIFTGELPEHGEEPLYEGSPITLAESMLAILTFTLNHNLTGACLSDLLKLICLHFLPSPRMRSTCYKFWSYFSGVKSPLIRHFYCIVCMQYLESKDAECQCETREGVSYFIEIPIVSQLQRLFLKPGFVADLGHKLVRRKKNQDGIEDIYDGLLYKFHSREGSILSNRNNISFMGYTDSTRVFNSSKIKILPFYLAINELPYRKRVLKDNILVAGIWFGKVDPPINLFLRPIHSQFTKLFEGVNLRIPDSDVPKRVRGLLLCGTGDTPARADMLNHVRFNAYYGCMNCKARGEYLRDDHVMVFPHEGPLELRSRNEHQQHAERALAEGEPVYGSKGPTILSRSMPDIIKGMGIDVMHCVFLGIVKRLAELWFNKGNRYCNFSLANFADLVDNRLQKMKVPSNVHRLPRNLTEDMGNWKAIEWKMWFFYYSVPILKDLMKVEYLQHYLQLLIGIHTLCLPSVSLADIDRAETLLKAFVSKVPALYGRRFMTINFHLLLHFPECVRNLGPLYVTSCFPFEDLNGVLLKYVHGTRQVGLQIYSSAAHSLVIPSMIQNLPQGSRARVFCERLETTGKRMVIREAINDYTFVCGKIRYPSVLSNELVQALLAAGLEVNGVSVDMFQRCRKGSQTIYSTSYGNSPSTISRHVIVFHRGQRFIALPKYFIRICHCETQECMPQCNVTYYAWVVYGHSSNPFKTTVAAVESGVDSDGENIDDPQPNPEQVTLPYIHEFPLQCNENEKILVPLTSIQCVCFSMQVGQILYVGEPVNLEEFE